MMHGIKRLGLGNLASHLFSQSYDARMVHTSIPKRSAFFLPEAVLVDGARRPENQGSRAGPRRAGLLPGYLTGESECLDL